MKSGWGNTGVTNEHKGSWTTCREYATGIAILSRIRDILNRRSSPNAGRVLLDAGFCSGAVRATPEVFRVVDRASAGIAHVQ